MELKYPCIITPRLMAGVKIGDAFVSIGYSRRSGDDGRVRYQYHIDMTGKRPVSGDDLQSGVGGGSLREGLESLLAFLGAFAEASNPRYGDKPGENADLFPKRLREWSHMNDDEISSVQLEVEETADCIVE